MKTNFTVNAKVEQLLGRHLITNKTVALYELIKNSYDAGARNVYIRFKGFKLIVNPDDSTWDKLKKANPTTKTLCSDSNSLIEIQDDGSGMTDVEILDNWLQLGTAIKEDIDEIDYVVSNGAVEKIDSKPQDLNQQYLKRILNGEKGIGRLGVDILGSKLELKAVSSLNTSRLSSIIVNWDAFNDHTKKIEDIKLELHTTENSSLMSSGVKLTISNLRERWSLYDYDIVVKNLRKMVAPDVVDNLDFQIHIEIYRSELDSAPSDSYIIKNDVFSNLSTFVQAEIMASGVYNYSITYQGVVAEKGTGEFLFHNDNERFGRAKFRAYYLDSNDKGKFTKLTGVSTRDYGNIRLYRDAFRVLPYGEPENDWLRIDQKHSQGLFRTLGSRDLLGYVQISRKQDWQNSRLRDSTNRLGLIEDDPAFLKLRDDFIWTVLKKLQSFIFKRIEYESRGETDLLKLKISEFKRAFDDDVESITKIIQEMPLSQPQKETLIKEMDDFHEKYEEPVRNLAKMTQSIDNRIKLLASLSSSETLLFKLFHEVKTSISMLKSLVIESEMENPEVVWEDFYFGIDRIQKFVDFALKSVNPILLPSESIPVNGFIKQFIAAVLPKLRLENIKIQNNLSDAVNNIDVQINRHSLDIAISNLIDNACKAVFEAQTKIISLDYLISDDSFVLMISDTGRGLSRDARLTLFSLGETTTRNLQGSGIGLTFTKSLIDKAGAKIELCDVPLNGFTTTFKLTFKYKRRS